MCLRSNQYNDIQNGDIYIRHWRGMKYKYAAKITDFGIVFELISKSARVPKRIHQSEMKKYNLEPKRNRVYLSTLS